MVPASDVSALFDWAQRHALALFPIKSYRKQPWGIVRSFAKDWSKDCKQWQAWWDRHRCNFGVVCGPSRVIVVDVDVDGQGRPRFDERWAAWTRGESFCVRTPSGGWHLYCRVPEGISSEDLSEPDWAKGIETRAGNGYVVSPWSATLAAYDPDASDGAYAIVKDCLAFPLAPDDLLKICKDRDDKPIEPPPVPADLAEDGYPMEQGLRLQVAARVSALVAVLRKAIPNFNRNKLLNETAYELGRIVAAGQIDRCAVETLLMDEAIALGLGRKEIRATMRSGLNAARGQPQVLRATLQALYAAPVPLQSRPAPSSAAPVCGSSGEPLEPIIERALIEGCVTVLSGHSGTGKTTIGASFMAASAANLRNFTLPAFGASHSDVIARPAAWVFASYEGGQFMDIHRRAWHEGVGVAEANPERRTLLNRRGCLVYSDSRRNVVFSQEQWSELTLAIDAARRANPGLPVVAAFDNVTSAVEDPTDQTQAAAFMRAMRVLADAGLAVLLLAHPPKSGVSSIYGSHIFYSLADIVGDLDVPRKNDGEWTQWISFPKHRMAPNGRSLELKSRKLPQPIIDLPLAWGGDARGRERALDDLRIPYIYQVCVRWESEKPAAQAGVKKIDSVSAKPAQLFNLPPISERPPSAPPVDGSSATILDYRSSLGAPPL